MKKDPEVGIVLPNEQIVALIKDYKENQNFEARNKVILANMGAVYRMAHRYEGFLLGKHVSFEDLVSDGVLGLIDAIEKFDSSLNTKFSTYSHWWILKKVTKNISTGPLELPFHRSQIYNKFKKEVDRCNELGLSVDMDKICEDIGISRDILIDTIQKQAPAKHDQKHHLLGAITEKEKLENDIIDGVVFNRIKEIINSDDLTARERKVIIDRFGLEESEPKTLDAIAKELDVTCEFVRIIQNKTILKLKKIIKRRKIARTRTW